MKLKYLWSFVVSVLFLTTGMIAQTTIAEEDFRDGSLPAGWTEIDVSFQTAAGGYARFDELTSILTSPSIDASMYDEVQVNFDLAKFGSGDDGPLTLEYSLDGGDNWIIFGDTGVPDSSTYISESHVISEVSADMHVRFTRANSPSDKRFRDFTLVGLESGSGGAGCLVDEYGQWPSATFTPNPALADGITVQNITTAGWAGEYSRMNVVEGETYKFSGSVPTDFYTISDEDADVIYAFGFDEVEWVANADQVIRFWTHTGDDCGFQNVGRTRSVIVGTPAVAPTTNAPDPTEDEDLVVSIFSDTYTDVAVANYDPNWGQSGHNQVNTMFDPTGEGNNFVLAYPNFNYQGTEIGSNLDLSDKDFLHVDIWVAAENSNRMVKVSPINNGTGVAEFLVEVPITPGSWNSVALPKSAFTDMTWDSVFQLKFDGQFNDDGTANTTPFDIYLDNIYFSTTPESTESGEDCNNAIVVNQIPFNDSGETQDFGNNYSASDRPALGGEQYTDGTGADSYLNGPDVVYAFTPDEDGTFNFDLSSSVNGWISFWLFEGCDPFTSIVARHTATTGDTRSLPEINLSAGQTYYVVISGWTVGTGPENYAFTLDITQITCPTPFDVVFNGSEQTSADFSWSDSSTDNSYDWVVVETGADIEDPANIVASGNADTNSVNVTGLTAATIYDFYVAAVCSADDQSDFTDPVQFSTACDTFGNFENDFSSELTGDVPLCWTGNTTSTGTAPNLEVTTVGSPQFGTQQVRMQSSGDAATVHYLISPELNNLADVDKRLRISARQLSATGANVLEVGVMTDPTDLSTFTVVETINFDGNALEDYDIILAEGTSENYFAFRATFSATFQTIYIDRVVYEDAPSCLEPANNSFVATNVGLDFIDVEWEAVEGVTDYEVAYGLEGFDPETQGEILLVEDQTNVTISDLEDGEAYDIYVRSLCSETEISLWSDVLSVNTLVNGATCDVAFPITTLPFTDSGNTADFGNNYSGADRPDIDSAQFTDGTGSASYLNGDDVVYSFTPANDGVFNFELNDIGTWVGFWLFEGCSPFTGTIAYSTTSSSNDRLLPLIQLQAGVTYYVVISTWPSPQSTPYELVVTEVLCTSPTSFQFDGIGTSSVDFSWTGADGEDDYNWFIYEAGADPETATPTDSGEVSETNAFSDAFLVEDVASYDVYIQTDCGDNQSELVGPFNFNVSACEIEDQCEYTFELIDSFGDGWNGNTMNVLQEGVVVATLGSNFTDGGSFTETVSLCSDIEFELFWNAGGSFANEVGVNIVDPDGVIVYTNAPGEGTQDSSLFTGVACPQLVFANAQIIHNSPDPAASSVDVYVNGDLLPELTGVDFRAATEFLQVPAEQAFTVDIVPAGGDFEDSVFTQDFTLDEDENYIIVANGFVNSNFELSVFVGAQQTSDDAGETSVLVHHGSPDAPIVNVVEQASSDILVNGIAYPEFQGYLDLPADDYVLDVTDTDGNVVATYLAPLSTLNLGGDAITVVASGLLASEPDAVNAFGLWVALASGGDLIPLPLVEPDPVFTNVQVIHNSPDPAASVVDVYLNGEPSLLMGVPFRTASPFVEAPAGVDFTIDVVPAGGDISQSVFSTTLNLEEDVNYLIVANGVLDPTGFESSGAFELSVYAGARTEAESGDGVDILVHHGSPDAPAVDVNESTAGNLISDIAYPEFDGYLELPIADYILEIAAAGNPDAIVAYQAPLETLGGFEGAAITIVASGFFGDDAGESNGFGLWVATVAGGPLLELPLEPTVSTVEFDSANFTYYPNPVSNELRIDSKNTVERVEVFNMLGQRVINQKPNQTNPTLNMSNFEAGVYLMKVSIDGVSKSFQLIKD